MTSRLAASLLVLLQLLSPVLLAQSATAGPRPAARESAASRAADAPEKTASVISEPTMLALLGGGLVALSLSLRRRKQHNQERT